MRGEDPGAGGDVEGMTTDLTFQRAVEDSGELAAPIFSLPPPFLRGLMSLQVALSAVTPLVGSRNRSGESGHYVDIRRRGNRWRPSVAAALQDVNTRPNWRRTGTQGGWETFSTPSRP